VLNILTGVILKKTVGSVLVLLACLSVTACVPGWSTTSSDSGSTEESVTKVYSVGDTITDKDGVSIKLTQLTTSMGQEYVKPDLDKFLLLSFEINNNSDSDISVSSLLSFSLASDSGLDFDVSPFYNFKNDLNGTVKSGRKLVGQIAFDISVESLYYVTFKPSVFGDDVEFQFSSSDFAG